MKFGGTSVADADKIRRVAERLVAAQTAGRRVVGVVSAMGQTTDQLVALARDVSPAPASARDGHAALDRRAHHRGAVRHGHQRPRTARGVAHGLAGRHRDRHRPHQGQDRRDPAAPDLRGARSRRDRARRRLPGRLDGLRRDDPRPGRIRHDGRRAGRGARRRLRDLHRRRRRLQRRSAHRPARPQAAARSRRSRCSRWPAPGRGCSSCARSSSPETTACRCMCGRPSPTRRAPGSAKIRAWRTPIISGITHTTDEAYVTLTDVPDKPGHRREHLQRGRRGAHQRRHDHPERRHPRRRRRHVLGADRRPRADDQHDRGAVPRPRPALARRRRPPPRSA